MLATRLRSIGLLLALSLLLAASQSVQSDTPSAGPPPPVKMTAEQDHQYMMDELHITSLRNGAEGFNKSAPNYQNNDESKANPYPNIPDALVMNNGKKVTSARMWWKERRPQIQAAFDEDLYGKVPKDVPKVTWTVTSVDRTTNGDVPVITKHLTGAVDNSSYPAITVNIKLDLTTPANATGPVPVIMEFGFLGPFPGFGGPRPNGAARPGGAGGPGGANATRPGGGGGGFGVFGPPQTGPTWQQQLLAKGWGYAVIDPNSFQADNGGGLDAGVIGLCNKGQPRTPDQWGALRAWAWGADRAMDYFQTDKAVNAKEVGIEGISRYGKATLVTMAYDPRFAIAFVGSSGEAGAKLWRRHWGEEEGNIASGGEYHWMAGNFLKYDGPLTVNDLPVDSNELIAMCAPRPTFISCGSPNVEGTWLDDKGMFMATALASPVYVLLGKKGLSTDQMPPEGTPLLDGDLAWSQHHGGHTDGPNWPNFINFAGKYFKAVPMNPAPTPAPAASAAKQ
ncbi:MAG TPA: hypothetical protein VFW40_14540 [Capsulimonadaceae bacterium]|nr:hypothetical protein [Capsulimonadaceae bacterium]